MFTNLASITTRGALAALALAVGAFLMAPAARAVEVGDEAPDFTLKTHDGKELTLSRLEGERGAVLVFFATTCPTCMAEVPHVKEFVEETRDRDVLVYGVDLGESEETVKRFVRDREVNYRVLLDSKGVAKRAYGVWAIPRVFGIDAAGVVRYKGYTIPRNTDAFVRELTAPLRPPHPPKAGVEERDRTEEGVSFISRETLQAWMEEDKDLLVIDVLSPKSYAQAHLPGAVNIPSAQLGDKAKLLADNRTIVTYCSSFSCRASTAAVRTLTELGFPDVHDYEGGLKDWKDADLPVHAATTEQGVDRVNIETLRLWVRAQEKVMGLDVRSAQAYHEGHIPGAANVSIDRLEKVAEAIPAEPKIVVYGAGGPEDQSIEAVAKLAGLGRKDVYSLVGGLQAWEKAGLPLAASR